MFVSKHDIDLLVSAMRELGSLARIDARHDRADWIDPDALGRMLWAENVKSLRHRYPTDRDAHRAFDAQVAGYSFTEYVGVKPGPIGRLADFFDHQTCEHPTWRDSDAFFAMIELRVQLARRLAIATMCWFLIRATLSILATCPRIRQRPTLVPASRPTARYARSPQPCLPKSASLFSARVAWA
jgi:hypothetical protein